MTPFECALGYLPHLKIISHQSLHLKPSLLSHSSSDCPVIYLVFPALVCFPIITHHISFATQCVSNTSFILLSISSAFRNVWTVSCHSLWTCTLRIIIIPVFIVKFNFWILPFHIWVDNDQVTNLESCRFHFFWYLLYLVPSMVNCISKDNIFKFQSFSEGVLYSL